MKATAIYFALAAAAGFGPTAPLFAADDPPKTTVARGQGDVKKSEAQKTPLTQEELEAKFKATLTKATMSGRWCPIKVLEDGRQQLGPDKEDKYTIIGVSKVGGDMWLIHSRIQYGNKDFVAPIPVQVKWAGDTPVIIVDNVGVPGGGSYTARVLVYDKTYAGTWSGGGHGGLLNGVITTEKE